MPNEELTSKESDLEQTISTGLFRGKQGEKGAMGTTATAALHIGEKVDHLSNSIKDLNESITNSTKSSVALTESIRTATWVGGLAALAGVIIAFFSFSSNSKTQEIIHIQEKIFDECFDYYASLSPETGMDKTTVQTCKDKATGFTSGLAW